MGKVLVLGGGVSGMQTSLDLSDMGHQVYLVEKETGLGGNLRKIYKIFPANAKAEELLRNFTEKIEKHKEISVLLDSTLIKVKEKNLAFEVGINVAGNYDTFDVDAIVLATGFVPYDPREKMEYGYSRFRDVVSSIDLEKMMKEGNFVRRSNSQKPKSVTFVQCVGFRDAKANMYCSSFCCTYTVKNALLIKKEYPEIEVRIMFMDIRTPFTYENLYLEARKIGIKFIRTRPAEIFEKNNSLVLNFEDTLTSETHSIESDMVVLSVGAIPPPETKKLSKMMSLSLDELGFFDVSHSPARTNSNRIFVAGVACGPKDVDYSLSQAGAAASQVNKLLRETLVNSE